MEALVRNSPATQQIQGAIKGLSVISCTYAPEKRDSSKSQVHRLSEFIACSVICLQVWYVLPW